MSAAIFDPQTSELLDLGVTEYRNIALAERAFQRTEARTGELRAGGSRAYVDALRELYEKARDLEAMREKARSVFAEKLGWTIGAPFSRDDLRAGKAPGPVEEEPCCAFMGRGRADYFYDDGGKPVGIVGHTRRRWSETCEFGTKERLDAHALPASWISPGVYIAVLYTKQGYVLPKP